jgi:hypothetical protein
MKSVLKPIFLSICFGIFFGSYAFPQTKQDSLKHWSIGVRFSPGLYFYRQFPDYVNKGIPEDINGGPLGRIYKGGSISKSLLISCKINKSIDFQAGFSTIKETMSLFSINHIMDHGNSWGRTRIYNYDLYYFESFITFKYNYSIRKKVTSFIFCGFNTGFLYKEFIEEKLDTADEFIGKNYSLRFNRIIPELGFGFTFRSSKPFSYSISSNFSGLPIYQKRNTYEFTNGVKLCLNAGVQYNF